MKKAFNLIYTIFASLVLIFAITFLCVNLYQEKSHGDLRTELRFEKLASSVIASTAKSNISKDELIRQIENAIGDKKDFAYIKITVNSQTVYLFPSDYTEEDISSNLISQRSKYQGQTKVSAGLYILRPSTIHKYTMITFYIILIITLLTVIVILYTNLKEKRKYYTVKKVHKIQKVRPHTDEEALEEEDFEEDFEEVGQSEEKTVVEEAPVKEDIIQEAPAKKEELPSHDTEPMQIKEEVTSEKGLFSPDTGFGWESYLMTRMENELKRATASELDLALFVLKFKGLERTDPKLKEICDYLTVEFQFKDLLFEYKEDCLCALKISMNIDDAISLGEKLVEDIKGILQDEAKKVYIGISTRGIRIVSGERLLKEADEAVVHAMEDDTCPVVGFRADAVKYRKFIETN